MIREAIAAVVASALGLAVSDIFEGVITEMKLYDAQRNHADFEGTWIPKDVRLAIAGRELAAYEQAERNHAAAEGAWTRQPLHMEAAG